MCCKQLAGNTGRKNDAKNRHLSTIAQLRRAISLQLRQGMYRQSEKNLLCSNISSRCLDNMVNFGRLAAEIGPVVWGTPANFNGFRRFASREPYCTALWYSASAKLCGVEQRAPPMFGRAAITLGIGPHSSYILRES